MSLSDDIIARVPKQVLVEHTNQRDAAAKAINTSFLGQVATDIQTWFETYAQESYSSSVAIHVQVCIRGAMSLMRDFGGHTFGASAEWWEKFEAACKAVKATRSRARLTPKNDSDLTPSDENTGTDEMRPWADDRYFDGMTLERGGTTGRDREPWD